MIQTVDKPNTISIGQDRETLTFKALLYLNVAVHAQVCRLFCVVYILLFSLVTPAIPNIFFGTVPLCYSGVHSMYVTEALSLVLTSDHTRKYKCKYGLDTGRSTSTRITIFSFSFACPCACVCAATSERKYHSGVTQAQRYLPPVVMFGQ